MNSFKSTHSFDKRRAEAKRIQLKYPDRIPVICERINESQLLNIDKNKFLVPKGLSVGQFIYVIRKRLKLSSELALFLFINGQLPATSSLMSEMYDKQKDIDGFLYIAYSGENTFGI